MGPGAAHRGAWVSHPFNETLLVFANFFTVNAQHTKIEQTFCLKLTMDFSNACGSIATDSLILLFTKYKIMWRTANVALSNVLTSYLTDLFREISDV